MQNLHHGYSTPERPFQHLKLWCNSNTQAQIHYWSIFLCKIFHGTMKWFSQIKQRSNYRPIGWTRRSRCPLWNEPCKVKEHTNCPNNKQPKIKHKLHVQVENFFKNCATTTNNFNYGLFLCLSSTRLSIWCSCKTSYHMTFMLPTFLLVHTYYLPNWTYDVLFNTNLNNI